MDKQIKALTDKYILRATPVRPCLVVEKNDEGGFVCSRGSDSSPLGLGLQGPGWGSPPTPHLAPTQKPSCRGLFSTGGS